MTIRKLIASCLALLLYFVGASGCGTPAKTVVVYSPHGKEVLGDYEKLFEAANPGVDVQTFDMGANDVLNRVRAERGRPAGDVWWGAPTTMFMQAVKDDLLDAYAPTWSTKVGEDLKDAQARWHATYLSPLTIVYNTLGMESAEAPKSWDELLDPKWKGRIVLRGVAPSGTMRTFVCAMIARAENEDAGIDWLKKLHAQVAAWPESPTLLFEHLKRNPDRISVWLMPDILMQRDLNSYPFGHHVPEGTPVLAEGIGILKNAPHPELARAFYEFVTTPEALKHQAATYYKMPARVDIASDDLPAEMTRQKIVPLDIDWQAFSAQEKAWITRWETEVMGAAK